MTEKSILTWLRKLTTEGRRIVLSEVGRWNASARSIHAGGRPKRLQTCPKCGGEFGSYELSRKCPEHKPRGEAN